MAALAVLFAGSWTKRQVMGLTIASGAVFAACGILVWSVAESNSSLNFALTWAIGLIIVGAAVICAGIIWLRK